MFFLIIKKVLLGIKTLITATATTSTISIIKFNYLFYGLLSFLTITISYYYCYNITITVTTLTATPTTATGIPPFQEKPGPRSNISGAEPVHYFKQPCTDTVNNEILHQANLYCQQYLHSHDVNLQQHPRALGHDFSNLNSTSENSITF